MQGNQAIWDIWSDNECVDTLRFHGVCLGISYQKQKLPYSDKFSGQVFFEEAWGSKPCLNESQHYIGN
jgi:hypothetical protein